MEATRNLIIIDVKRGETLEGIKNKYNISVNYIKGIIRSSKSYIDNNDFKFNVNVYNEMMRRYNNGTSLSNLARVYNLEELVVQEIITRKGKVKFNPVNHSVIIKMLRDTDLGYREMIKEVDCSIALITQVNTLYNIR